MEIESEELPGGVILRPAAPGDAEALHVACVENREHLRPWEPRRPEDFFTAEGQKIRLDDKLRQFAEGRLVPWHFEADGRIVGAITLTGIILGPFCSAYLGYWIAADQQGRGLATAAVERVCWIAREAVGLHRIEATTVVDNAGSQRVLAKCGFEQIGLAPRYLHVDGEWRDHRMFQKILHEDDPQL
ncbi:GNAT family protein [Streptomyces sp. S.PB5]|uniref:GNAT family N-acetyltransferase n=1 Tax=Streptomyces sp. S.PB5 TaxID=3020844 RepID=UPI0025AECE94|nr:GNAT family protein [Streptomyces sp. S.PB5]MDN3023788.1 GNAT family protein [Streptomyces sp. S.PB5]